MRVALTGRGGHTARPHLTGDLVYALGRIVTELHSRTDREITFRAMVYRGPAEFEEKVAPWRDWKDTVRFPLASEVPFDVIELIVAAQVASTALADREIPRAISVPASLSQPSMHSFFGRSDAPQATSAPASSESSDGHALQASLRALLERRRRCALLTPALGGLAPPRRISTRAHAWSERKSAAYAASRKWKVRGRK